MELYNQNRLYSKHSQYTHKSSIFNLFRKFIIECLDEVKGEQEKLMKVQKDNVRLTQRHREQIERRRLENEQRRLRNEELLPDIAPHVKKFEMPTQIPTLLMSNHVGRVGKGMSAVIGDSLGRTFFVSMQIMWLRVSLCRIKMTLMRETQ